VKKYGITTLIGLAAAAALYVLRGGMEVQGSERLRILCDAFTLPGVMMILFCGLIFDFTGNLL